MFELVINLKTAKASIVCSIFTTTILATILGAGQWDTVCQAPGR